VSSHLSFKFIGLGELPAQVHGWMVGGKYSTGFERRSVVAVSRAPPPLPTLPHGRSCTCTLNLAANTYLSFAKFFSRIQLLIDARRSNDWSSITGNPAKVYVQQLFLVLPMRLTDGFYVLWVLKCKVVYQSSLSYSIFYSSSNILSSIPTIPMLLYCLKKPHKLKTKSK
jgi:hypothetical protein